MTITIRKCNDTDDDKEWEKFKKDNIFSDKYGRGQLYIDTYGNVVPIPQKKEPEDTNYYNNPKKPNWDEEYHNCDYCMTGRAKKPSTKCINCKTKEIICVRKGCNNKSGYIGGYCDVCSKGLLYMPICEKDKCEIRTSQEFRYCRVHMTNI